jgi:hypothetical protein
MNGQSVCPLCKFTWRTFTTCWTPPIRNYKSGRTLSLDKLMLRIWSLCPSATTSNPLTWLMQDSSTGRLETNAWTSFQVEAIPFWPFTFRKKSPPLSTCPPPSTWSILLVHKESRNQIQSISAWMKPNSSTHLFPLWATSFPLWRKTTQRSSFLIVHQSWPGSLKIPWQAIPKSASFAHSILHKTIRIKLIRLCCLPTDARKYASPTNPSSVFKLLRNLNSKKTWKLP